MCFRIIRYKVVRAVTGNERVKRQVVRDLNATALFDFNGVENTPAGAISLWGMRHLRRDHGHFVDLLVPPVHHDTVVRYFDDNGLHSRTLVHDVYE
jgi:hypothetical protein